MSALININRKINVEKIRNRSGELILINDNAAGSFVPGTSHEPVTIGTANGLSLTGQTLSLDLASTSSAGAMSATDKTNLNNLSNNLFTLKSNDVEDGINISPGDTLIIQGSENVEVSRSGYTLTISADTPSGGITTLSGGIAIDVTGSGSSRTISAKVDNDTIIIDELNNQMMVDSSKYATPSQLHNAVTIGTKANGLNIDGQKLELYLATITSAGAMSAADKTILNNLNSNLFTLKSNDVEDGIDITAGDTVTIQGSENVEVSRSGYTLTITASTSSGGITTLSGGIAIDVSGSGTSRTISAKIDNDTIIIDELNNQMMVDSSKYVTPSGTTTSGYVPRFTSSTQITNSSIRDNGSSISVGAVVNSNYKIYAYGNNGYSAIRGYNASTSSGSNGVSGEANGSGTGYLSYYDGSRRAAIYGIVGSGSGTKYAAYFSGDTLTTGDVYSNSDARLKENIKEIENPLERLMKVNPVQFNWKNDEKINYGVIAQELLLSYPELVASDGEYLTVRYNEFIGILIKTIQEQEKRIKKLENGTINY